MRNYVQTWLFLVILLFSHRVVAQDHVNKKELLEFASTKKTEFEAKKSKALKFANKNNLPVFIQTGEGLLELMQIDEYNQPQYYSTDNSNSAKTISTNKVHNSGGYGLSLSGAGLTVHEWDAGAVRASHQEFGGRVTQGDNASYLQFHSSHIAGTLIASGVVGIAKGMAPEANLRAFDWNNDMSEMASEAANHGALVSNHSYGYARGWVWNGSSWSWQGNQNISTQEDYLFGFYDAQAHDWDEIAYNAPYYLMVKSAGNDRDDDGPDNPPFPSDGPYDCISHAGIAKNILTVGAVKDIANGYSEPSDVILADFSSWGPADDGRIKPDIVTNGFGMYSTGEDHDADYGALSGTSMAAPSAAGSLILLQEHYKNLHGEGVFMKAATLKGLVIHTADEAGASIGPDYEHGHGLMNTLKAAQLITEDETNNNIEELTLNNNDNYTRVVKAKGNEPLFVTISWTDKPGTPVAAMLDPTDAMLVNDLDLRVEDESVTYYPWKLDRNNPAAAASRNSKNFVDNVEVLKIDNPVPDKNYTIVVDHDGALSGGYQNFSLIVSGIKANDSLPPVAAFGADQRLVQMGQEVGFLDESTNVPLSWNWSFEGGTPGYSTSKNPVVSYASTGTFSVSLTVSNSKGSDSVMVSDFITVIDQPNTYCTVTGNTYQDFWIAEVELNAYTKNTSGDGYSDFTSDFIELDPSSNTIALSPGFSGAKRKMSWRVWIDWNKDGDFDDPDELVFEPLDSKVTVNGSFNTPADFEGFTVMRVGSRRSVTGTLSPCINVNNGEFEDYSVTFGNANSTSPPTADFTSDKTTVFVGDTVNFTDLSANEPTSWSWSFEGGSPSTDTAQNPGVIYDTVGVFSVNLMVANEAGSDSILKSTYITVLPTVSYCTVSAFNYDKTWISNVEINGMAKNSGGDGYSYFNNDVMGLNETGNDFSLTPEFIGNPYRVYFRVWVDWNTDGDFDDDGELVYTSPRVTGLTTGSFEMPVDFSGTTRLRIGMQRTLYTLPLPCADILEGEFEDYLVSFGTDLGPEADFVASDAVIEEGSAVEFNDISSNNPTSWAWTFEGGYPENSTEQNPVVQYNIPGSYSVHLVVNNSSGTDSVSKSGYIIVNEGSAAYCEVTGTNFDKYWISEVEVNGFFHSSEGFGYADYTSDTIELGADTSYYQLTPGFSGAEYTMKWQVWVDWNFDSDFDDEGELVANPDSDKAAVSGYFLVPAGFSGQTTMRVASQRTKFGIPVACVDINGGEFEDYLVSRNLVYSSESVHNDSKRSTDCYLLRPNPVTDKLTIDAGSCHVNSVFIYSLAGELVMSSLVNEESLSIDVSKLLPGFYVVKFVGENSIGSGKFIKQ